MLTDKKNVIVNAIKNLIMESEYVSEIETNGPGLLFYKERGKRKSISIPAVTREEYNEAIDGLIEDAGLVKRKYLIEGRYNLPNSRFGRLHIVMPPACPYPLVTLAIKSTVLSNLTAIQSTGTFNTEISRFLKAAIGSKLTMVISGGTGHGKTTLLEALTGEFTEEQRIGICEDAPELRLNTPNTVYMNSTVWAPGMNEKEVVPLDWIVKQANRMRVDRIIVGETRGKEYFDFITAANSGLPGSLTTIHADTGHDCMKKMATFMYMAVDMSPRIINEMLASTIDIVIQLGKNSKTGDHKIISIHEVTNAISTGDSPTIALHPLFLYDDENDNWNKKFATDNLKKKLEMYKYNSNTYTIQDQIDNFEGSSGFGLPTYFKREEN